LFPLLVNLFNGVKEKNWFLKRSNFLGLGFLTPLAALMLICILIGKDFFSDYAVYLHKIVQGDFSEGWSLPVEYFWHAEHGFILIVGSLIIAALFQYVKERHRFLSITFGGILFVYLCLAIPSLAHIFVVYARTARQWMPFLVLAAAYGLSVLQDWKPGGRWLINGLITLSIVQALWNYQLSYKIIYPREFVQQIQKQYPDFRISDKMMGFSAPLICKNNGFLAENFHIFHNWTGSSPSVQGEILMKAPHPENFLPHQYDGYTPAERQALREENIEMVFYKLDPGSYRDIENCYQPKTEK
jgi:hypothetical protein